MSEANLHAIEAQTHAYLKRCAKALGIYASALLCASASTMRIERNLRQIAEAWDIKAEFTILPTNVVLNIWDQSGEHSYSCLSPIGPVGINFAAITQLTVLSERVLSEDLGVEQLLEAIAQVQAKPRLAPQWVLLLASLANASFCRLFGGDWWAIGIVFVATVAGFYVKQRLTHWSWDYRAVTILSGLTAAVLTSSGFVFRLSQTPDIALATSVLYLVPGIPFCNAVSDLIYGHYVCAVSRFLHAMMITVSLSIGLCLALLLVDISML